MIHHQLSLNTSSPCICHEHLLPNNQAPFSCQLMDVSTVKALWQHNYILGSGRAIAGKFTDCVRCNFPGLQQVWWSTVWIKWSDSHWQWFGFILSLSLPHSFSSHRINFGHICPYKNGCHQCLLKKYKLLDRRLLRWEYKVWEGDMEKKKKKRTKAELENARWGKEWEVKTMSVKWTAGKNCVE